MKYPMPPLAKGLVVPVFALLAVYAAQWACFPFLRDHVLPFTLFAGLYLFIPSIALAKYICRDANWGWGIRTLLAYPLVLCAHFVVAWVITIVPMPFLVHVFPITAIAALLFGNSETAVPARVFGKPEVRLMSAVFILLITFMWAGLWERSIPPSEEQVGHIYQDLLWNVGNVWSALRGGWPLMDPRAYGEPLSYHLAQSLVHSEAYRVTGIHPLFLQNYFFPVLDLFFLASVLVWGARVVGGLSFYPVVWLCVALLVAKGWGWYYHVHVFWNPLTFFFTLAPFTLFVFVTKAYFEGRIKLPIAYLVGLYVLLIASKMNLALIIVPALGLTYLYRAVKGGTFIHKHELLLGTLCVAGTFTVKSMLFSSGDRGVFIGSAVTGSRVWEWLGLHLQGLPNPLLELIFGMYLVVTRLPAFLISPAGGVLLVLAFVLYKLKNRAALQSGFVAWSGFIVAMVLVSTIERYFLQYEEFANGSFIYFEWYSMWLLPIFAAGLLSIIPVGRQAWMAVTGITFIGVVSFVASVVSYVAYVSLKPGPSDKTIVKLDMRETVDFGEWDALMWINQNLPEYAVIASDRRAFREIRKTKDLSRFFAYSGLSGRQFLMEGEDFMGGAARLRLQQQWSQFEAILAQGDAQALKEYLRVTPTQYFLQSLRFNKMDLSQLPDYKLIYENSSVRIYSIPRAS